MLLFFQFFLSTNPAALALALLILVAVSGSRAAVFGGFGLAAPARELPARFLFRGNPRSWRSAARAIPVLTLFASVFFGNGLSLAVPGATPTPIPIPEGSTVYGWGNNGYGQLGTGNTTNSSVPVSVLTNGVLKDKTVVQIVGGSFHSMALCSDGTLAAWGINGTGQLGNNSTDDSFVPVLVDRSGVLKDKTIIQIAAGAFHSLALCSDGTVACWGMNRDGRLGNGGTNDSVVPVLVDRNGVLSDKMVVQVAAGESHSLALCSDGTVATWGRNHHGQLGTGNTNNALVPVLVSTGDTSALSGKTVIQVTGGGDHSLALCNDGTVVAWGTDELGELGRGEGGASSIPVFVDGNGALSGKTVTQLVAGYFYSAALCSDGTVATWGDNRAGQLGTGSTSSSSAVPVTVATDGVLNNKTVVEISGGAFHLVALCSDGVLATWGDNDFGQLGNNSTATSRVPVLVDTSGILRHHPVVRLMQGNPSKQTLVIAAPSPAPVIATNTGLRVAQNAGQTSITSGHLKATDTEGSTLTYTLSAIPSQGVLKLNGTALKAGDSFTQADIDAGLLSFTPNLGARVGSDRFTFSVADGAGATMDGTFVIYVYAATPATGSLAYSWGFNNAGQLGNGSQSDSNVPVSVLTSGALSGKTVTQVATGANHSLALCSDGTVAAWGFNSFGQLGNGSQSDSNVPVLVDTSADSALSGKTVTQVAAGNFHSVALCSDGTLVAWGWNNGGQLGNGDDDFMNSLFPVAVVQSGVLSDKTVVQVVAGSLHCLALCGDGTLVAWGRNNTGQLGNGSQSNSNVPVVVGTSDTSALSDKTVVQVVAGTSHSVALCSDGTVVTWGDNLFGQLGNGNNTRSLLPVLVSTSGDSALSGKTVTQVGAGSYHSLALCSDGTVATWGNNQFGQLGNNSTTDSVVPVSVVSSGALKEKTVVQLASGHFYSVALCSDGTVVSWGNNAFGQLGDGKNTHSSVPVAFVRNAILRHRKVVQLMVGIGNSHNLVIAAPSNFAPVVESVTITPNTPSSTMLLTANATASDADDDTVTFSYQWQKNGQDIVGATGSTLDLSVPGNGDEGDVITVVVIANDASEIANPTSAPVTSPSVTIQNFLPTVVSVTPLGATDAVGASRTFTLAVSDPNGASDISEMWLLVNTSLSWDGGATLVYFPKSGELYLRRGDGFGSPIKIGRAAGTGDVLDNGALRIVGSEVSLVADPDGNTLTLTIPATIRNGLIGQNTLFGRVQDAAGAVDATAPQSNFGFVSFGPYTVTSQFASGTNRIPALSALSPRAAFTVIPTTGTKMQTFVFYAKDEDGIGDLDSLWFMAGKQRDWAGSATFVFLPRTRRLYLRSDDGQSFLGGGVVGSAGIIENSQVKVDLAQVQYLIYGDGKNVGLRLTLQPKAGLIGQNTIWLRVQDNSGATSTGGDNLGFVQSGTWNVTKQSGTTSAAAPSAPGS